MKMKKIFDEAFWNLQTIIISILIISSFVLGIYAGYNLDNNLKYQVLSTVLNYIDDATSGSSGFGLIGLIFLNNLQVSALLIISGFTIFLPFVIVFFNGVVIGLVDYIVKRILTLFGVIDPLFTLKGLIVHGIPEMIAIFFAAVIGVYLGVKFWIFMISAIKYVFNNDFVEFRRKRRYFKTAFMKSLPLFIRIIIPLLLVAAFLEVLITPFIMGATLPENFQSIGIISINETKDYLEEYNYSIDLEKCNISTKANTEPSLLLVSIIRDDYYDFFDNLLNNNHTNKDYITTRLSQNNNTIHLFYAYDFTEFIDYYDIELNFSYDNFTSLFNDSYTMSSTEFVCDSDNVNLEIIMKK